MRQSRAVTALVILVLLAACSGGGGSAPTPVLNGTNPAPTGKTVMIQLNFTIPGGVVTSSNSRSPQFVSNAIKSAILTAYQPTAGVRGNSDSTNSVSTYADLSSTSPNCSANGNGSRSCSIFLPAPVTAACVPAAGADGCDFFEIDTYAGNPSPSTPCGGGVGNPACTGVNGNELSIGTDGGNGVGNSPNGIDNGYTVTAGSSISVSLGLEGIINSFVLTSPASYPTGVGSNWPVPFNDLTHPLLVLSGLAGIGPNTTVVLESQPGFPNAVDASGGTKPNIASGTCTNGDLFANGITTNAVTSGGAWYAVDGGAGGSQQAVLSLQPCGTSGFLANPTQGINTYFPADQIMAQYLGGGGAGAQEPNGLNHPPYFAYIAGTNYTMFATGVPAQNNWVSPPASATNTYAHPYPLTPVPVCGTGTCTAIDAVARNVLSLRQPEGPIFGTHVNLAVAPLFAQTYTGSAGSNESDSASTGHAVLVLSGSGSSGRIYADQVVAPTFGTNNNFGSLGASYTATLSTGCSGTAANGTAQVAASIGSKTVGTGSGTFFGAQWTVTAGNLPSNGSGAPTTSCVITLSDGVNSVPVWISNSIASGGVSIPTQQHLFVANFNGNNILVYPEFLSGNVTSAPFATIGGGSTGIGGPVGVGVDPSGKIYVANNGGAVTVYPANPSGNVTSAPLATIGGGSTGIANPVGVAFDASGKVYVANYGNSTVTVYAANPSGNVSGAPLATIGGGSTGIANPFGVALDRSGKIYVANYGNNTVTVYAANPSGNVSGAPLATIGGGSTGIANPVGVALDASGQIYVANQGNNNILVFAANPSGNVSGAPLATIGGGSTGISGPRGVALDASGQIYVANQGNNTVTVYAANPSGNVSGAPLATIGGGSTGINFPLGVAVQ
jgi:DNA-binding beta-propeller fold protein YncE